MNENVIQNQIKLAGFKVVDFSFKTKDNSEGVASRDKKFNLDLDDILYQKNPNHFAKAFKVELIFDDQNFNDIYSLNIEYHVIFECLVNVNEGFLESDFAKISAPAIGFPYLRAFISTFTIQAGVTPIILPSINFIQFSKELDKIKKTS